MARQRFTMRRKEAPEPLARIVEAIKQVGPGNISKIARRTGLPVETTRYKLKRQLLTRGFRIHVNIDYGKLGLTRYWLSFDFARMYRSMAVEILKTLAEVGYLILYARLTPSLSYVAIVAMPTTAKEHCRALWDHLVELGVLQHYELHEIAWARYFSMRPAYYNFHTRSWEVDWEALQREKLRPAPLPPAPEAIEVDKIDVLILKELQRDATVTLASIARKLKINPKTLRYHYNRHVVAYSLIVTHLVRWMGDIESTKRHTTLLLKLWLRGLSSSELAIAQATFHRLPFTWAEMLSSDGNLYLTEVNVPLPYFRDTLSYLAQNFEDFTHKMEYGVVDLPVAGAHTIPHQMFDEAKGWIFNIESVKQRFTNLAETLISEPKKRKGASRTS